MTSRTLAFAVVALFGLAVSAADAQERLTVWLTVDPAKAGPAVRCDGELRVTEGGKVAVREWMHEGNETVEGAAFQFRTDHDARTAEAAKLRFARRTTLSKGLLVSIEAPASAVLSAATKLGDFSVPLDQLRKQRTVLALDGKVRLQLLPNVTQLTADQAEEEFPSVAALPDGRVAVAYVAWDGQKDKVLVRVGDDVREVTEQPGDYHEPRAAVDGQGRLWIVWAANSPLGEQWDLWARSDGKPMKLTTNPRNDFWPRLARDSRGNLWLAWQTVADDLHYEIMLARLGPDGLSAPINVSEHPADDWEPALCATPDGRIVVAWDTYRNGSFDIYLREFSADGKPLRSPMPVAATAKREAHATLASDSRSCVWLAWDVSIEEWGKHPQRASLHSSRETDLACYADGKLHRLAADFMRSLPPPFGRFIEYPQVAVDGQDRVWVFFRLANVVSAFYRAQKDARAQTYSTWHLFASQYEGTAWSPPVLLAQSNGRQDVRVDVARNKSGELLVAFAADGRTRRAPYMPVDYDVFLASLAGFGTPVKQLQFVDLGDLGQVTPARPDPELAPLPREWSVGGKTYRLVLGDTHRHTDISRCGNGHDGSLQDAYRYALDACGLDWLAISDHDQDLMKHRNDKTQRPRQDYDWWHSQKYCDLYTIPGRFVAVYGYEHGRSYQQGGGHKNILTAQRGLPVREDDAQAELFAALANSGAIAIPHQLADGGSRMDWEKWSAEYERVGEIFQARGSYEFSGCPRAAQIFTDGNSLWDALAKGIRIGIIASSDHGQTHQARAGVYVHATEPAGAEVRGQKSGTQPKSKIAAGFTRGDILNALRARRAFGATIACVVQVNIGNSLLGEELQVSGPPKLEAKIIAPADIAQVQVVRDGQFVYTAEPKAPQTSFDFADLDLKPGQTAYYYVRAQIGPSDFAWSSPLWVTRMP